MLLHNQKFDYDRSQYQHWLALELPSLWKWPWDHPDELEDSYFKENCTKPTVKFNLTGISFKEPTEFSDVHIHKGSPESRDIYKYYGIRFEVHVTFEIGKFDLPKNWSYSLLVSVWFNTLIWFSTSSLTTFSQICVAALKCWMTEVTKKHVTLN